MSSGEHGHPMDEYEEVRTIYNEIAELYHKKRLTPEDSTWNDLLEVPAMEAMLRPLVQGKRVLDLGCGTGLLTRTINDWGGHVRGIDISEEMIRLAREQNPKLEFVVGRSDNLPFDDGEFDIVASSLVMHYLKDLLPTFKEVSRILVSGGRFIFSMHHPFSGFYSKGKSAENSTGTPDPYFHNESYYWRMCGRDILSFHHTFEDIIRSLKESGFSVRDMVECRPEAGLQGSFDDFQFTSKYPTFCVFDTSR